MTIRTEPMVDCGVPCVRLKMGDTEAQLTAQQSEELAESLSRAATAARYESAIAEMLATHHSASAGMQRTGITRVREIIERRRLQGN